MTSFSPEMAKRLGDDATPRLAIEWHEGVAKELSDPEWKGPFPGLNPLTAWRHALAAAAIHYAERRIFGSDEECKEAMTAYLDIADFKGDGLVVPR